MSDPAISCRTKFHFSAPNLSQLNPPASDLWAMEISALEKQHLLRLSQSKFILDTLEHPSP